MLQRMYENNEIKEVNIRGWDKPKEDINVLKEDVAVVKAEVLEQKTKKEEKKKENRILIDLMNNNVISVRTLDNNILDKRFISVLCYQAGFSVKNQIISQNVKDEIDKILLSKKIKSKKEKLREKGLDTSREYHKMFDDIGFIKLANHNEFYIIPEDNIYPEKLRNLDKLSNYLIKQGMIIVDEEWNKLKEIHKKHDKEFYQQMQNESNPVNFNMLIMRINRRDMRHRFILRNDFNKKFTPELSAIIKLSEFKTLASEKVAIKTIISQSSLKILILSLPEKEREKVLSLEETFTKPQNEGGLGIKNFYDYHTKDVEDIKRILRIKFKKSEEKISKYAQLIYNNSRDYKEDLIELGINI